jgi:hypothetical protein
MAGFLKIMLYGVVCALILHAHTRIDSDLDLVAIHCLLRTLRCSFDELFRGAGHDAAWGRRVPWGRMS